MHDTISLKTWSSNNFLFHQADFKTNSLIMTNIFEKQPSPEASNYASSSGVSGDDKEIGCRGGTSKRYLLANNSSLHFSTIKFDMNCARMVRVYSTLLSISRGYPLLNSFVVSGAI